MVLGGEKKGAGSGGFMHGRTHLGAGEGGGRWRRWPFLLVPIEPPPRRLLAVPGFLDRAPKATLLSEVLGSTSSSQPRGLWWCRASSYRCRVASRALPPSCSASFSVMMDWIGFCLRRRTTHGVLYFYFGGWVLAAIPPASGILKTEP